MPEGYIGKEMGAAGKGEHIGKYYVVYTQKE